MASSDHLHRMAVVAFSLLAPILPSVCLSPAIAASGPSYQQQAGGQRDLAKKNSELAKGFQSWMRILNACPECTIHWFVLLPRQPINTLSFRVASHSNCFFETPCSSICSQVFWPCWPTRGALLKKFAFKTFQFCFACAIFAVGKTLSARGLKL